MLIVMGSFLATTCSPESANKGPAGERRNSLSDTTQLNGPGLAQVNGPTFYTSFAVWPAGKFLNHATFAPTKPAGWDGIICFWFFSS